MHGAYCVQVLLDDRLCGPPALLDIALQTSNEADVGVGIHEYLYVEEPAQGRLGEYQDAFDQDDWLWLDAGGLLSSAVGFEIINRQVDGLPGFKLVDVGDEQFAIQRIGVVKIDRNSLSLRKCAEVFVIGIMR